MAVIAPTIDLSFLSKCKDGPQSAFHRLNWYVLEKSDNIWDKDGLTLLLDMLQQRVMLFFIQFWLVHLLLGQHLIQRLPRIFTYETFAAMKQHGIILSNEKTKSKTSFDILERHYLEDFAELVSIIFSLGTSQFTMRSVTGRPCLTFVVKR